MTRHIVARTSDIPPGGNKVFGVEGRDIVVFHVNGEFFALLQSLPARGRAAGESRLRGAADLAGARRLSALARRRAVALPMARLGVRHAQRAVDLDPKRVKVRSYPVAIESGEELPKGPYVAETFPVHVEDSYVIIET